MGKESSCKKSLGRLLRALLVWPQVRNLLQCRLCWKIALAVMVSILAIEIAVLIPSYQTHQRDLMAKLHASGRAAVIAGFKFNRLDNDHDLLQAGKFLVEEDLLKGGSLYRADGTLIGHFGERPQLTPALAARDKVKDIHPAGGRRMDLIWTRGDTGLPFTVIGHLDSSKIAAQMMAYVMRIAGLVLIISLFLCAATMLALSRIILVPLLRLRAKLAEACDDPANLEKYKLNLELNDEFGDVVDRFNTLLHLVSQTHDTAFAQQAQLLTTTFDTIAHALAIYDAEARLIGYNKQFEEHFEFPPGFLRIGITLEEISRQRVKQGHFGTENTEEVIAGRVRRTMALKQEKKVERTLPNGNIFISHHKPMPGGGGVTSYTDITDRKQAERELAEKSALLETIFNNMSQGFAVFDAEARLVAFNNRLVALRGYPPGVLRVGMKYQDLVRFNAELDGLSPAQAQQRVDDRIQSVNRREKHQREITLPNGKVIVIHRNPMPDGGFVTTYTDITERRQAETLSQRFGRILDNSFNEIYVFNSESYRFIQVSQGALSNLGYDQMEIAHLTPWDLNLAFDEKSFKAKVAPLLRGEIELLVFETAHQRKDGSHYPVEVRMQLSITESPPVFVAIIADITERKQAEKIIQDAKEQAEFANRAKSEFLANMSHELRTPLNAVIGFSEVMMTQGLGAIGEKKYREYAEDINSSGQHLLGLINDILDLSKVEAGKTELQEEEIDPVGVVRSCISMVKGQACSQGLDLETDMAEQLPWLRADKRLLKQAIINLLSNAVKFTRKGGKVTLKAWCKPKSGFVFQVIDTGIGLSLEDIPKVMQPFTQIDSELSRIHQGTGLGLPLVKHLVELHGGSVDIQSEVGAGTTVTIRLPAERIVPGAPGDYQVGRAGVG